jgi:hypothetical protein
MNNILNTISTKIFTFVATTFLTVSSIFTKSSLVKEKFLSDPTPTPIVLESLSPSPITEEITDTILVSSPIIKDQKTDGSVATKLPYLKQTSLPVDEVKDPTGIDWDEFKKDLDESLKDVPGENSIKETKINGVPFHSITNTPEPLYINLDIEEKLNELRNILNDIQGESVALSVIEGRKLRAYQDWIQNNYDAYSSILNSRYITDLEAITTSYGL